MNKSKYIIVNERISNGYYAYRIYLLDVVNKCNVDYDTYGELAYWGIPNEYEDIDTALDRLLNKYNISKDDIEIVSCGGWFQDGCEEEIIDMIFKSCYEV